MIAYPSIKGLTLGTHFHRDKYIVVLDYHVFLVHEISALLAQEQSVDQERIAEESSFWHERLILNYKVMIHSTRIQE